MSASSAPTEIEFDIGQQQSTKIRILTQWRQALAASTATSLPLVAGHVLKPLGTPFEFIEAPKVGKMYRGNMVTKALLPQVTSGHVKYLMAASDQIIALQNKILGCLGQNIKTMLECNTIYVENQLSVAGEGKLHLLLQAIQVVCSTREGGTRETLTADLLTDIANLRMGKLGFSEYCEVVRAQCDAARASGFGISEAQEVVFVVRGLERDFLPIKEALESAAAVSGNGLPTTRAALRAAAVRIEATLGNKVSAFSAKVEDQSKRRGWDKDEKAIFDEGFRKGAKKGGRADRGPRGRAGRREARDSGAREGSREGSEAGRQGEGGRRGQGGCGDAEDLSARDAREERADVQEGSGVKGEARGRQEGGRGLCGDVPQRQQLRQR